MPSRVCFGDGALERFDQLGDDRENRAIVGCERGVTILKPAFDCFLRHRMQLIVRLTGLYMLGSIRAWVRFVEPPYWWMHAMVGLWVVFGLMLFIVEPLVVGPRIRRNLENEPHRALARMEALHWLLLALSLVVIRLS
jgi:hypothetical protein